MTVYLRRREFGMLDEPRTNISGELLVFVEDVRSSEPESGEVIVMGELWSHSYTVTRHRVRHAIQLSDPLNTVGSWHRVHTLSQDPFPCGTLVRLLAISPIMILDIACVQCYRHTRNVH